MLPHTHRTFELRQGLLVHALVLALAQIRTVVRKGLLLLLLMLRLFRWSPFVRIITTSRWLVTIRSSISITIMVMLLRLPNRRRRVPVTGTATLHTVATAAIVERRLVGIKSQAILVVRLTRHGRALDSLDHKHPRTTTLLCYYCFGILRWHLDKGFFFYSFYCTLCIRYSII